MTALSPVLERELELDRYRLEVERHLGPHLTVAREEDLARLFDHLERCFDWGVSAAACARTWLADVETHDPEREQWMVADGRTPVLPVDP